MCQGYTTTLPTSLGRVNPFNKRLIVEETGCGFVYGSSVSRKDQKKANQYIRRKVRREERGRASLSLTRTPIQSSFPHTHILFLTSCREVFSENRTGIDEFEKSNSRFPHSSSFRSHTHTHTPRPPLRERRCGGVVGGVFFSQTNEIGM